MHVQKQELYKRNGRCEAVRYEGGAIVIDNGEPIYVNPQGGSTPLIVLCVERYIHISPLLLSSFFSCPLLSSSSSSFLFFVFISCFLLSFFSLTCSHFRILTFLTPTKHTRTHPKQILTRILDQKELCLRHARRTVKVRTCFSTCQCVLYF
jgi:hypothetical protein